MLVITAMRTQTGQREVPGSRVPGARAGGIAEHLGGDVGDPAA